MGQQISTQDAVECIKTDLSLDHYIECQSADQQNIKSFITVVGKKWLDHLHQHNEVTFTDELKHVTHQNFQHQPLTDSTFTKVCLHVIKKDIPISVYSNDEKYENDTLYGLLHEYHEMCQSSLQHKSSAAPFKCADTKPLQWDELVNILKQQYNPTSSNLNINPTHFQHLLCMYENNNFVYIFEDYPQYTLLDALKYSPSLIQNNHASILFLFYQLLKIFLKLKHLGLQISPSFTLQDIFLNKDNLWMSVSPFTSVTYHSEPLEKSKPSKIIEIYKGKDTDLTHIQLEHKLTVYTDAWCKKEISNFDYLIILNKLSGRRFGESLNHPVFPWVTNFSQCNGGLRNLTKTKYRLNKGDRQLDMTYSSGVFTPHNFGTSVNQPIQHHVSDVLSDITYYIYHARDTDKDTLCKHVRSRWVPDEYPSSIERIYDWSPDECIPEFFYDPNILISIHNDLTDLGLPEFINTPQDFVQYHYDYLESNHVSALLHKWIDLIFGCALEGDAAKENKNVHLSLVDNHQSLRNYGIVQLFRHPHPKRVIRDEGKDENLHMDFDDPIDGDVSLSWEYVDLTSSMKKNKEEVILDQDDTTNQKRQRARSLNEGSHQTDQEEAVFSNQPIDIAGFNFLEAMENAEDLLRHEVAINPPNQTSIGQYEFGSIFSDTVKDDIEDLPTSDSQLFMCILIEIVLYKELLSRTFQPSLDVRYKENIALLKLNQKTPSWLRSFLFDMVGEDSLQKPSPYLSIHSLNPGFHFPVYFPQMHEFLASLYQVIQSSNGEIPSLKLTNQIEQSCHMMPALLEQLNAEGKETLLTYLLPFFQLKHIQIHMFLHIFPPLSSILGPDKSTQIFIKPLQTIYDSDKTPEDVALLQQTFLSKALSSFGQDSFLKLLMGYILDTLTTNNHLILNHTPNYNKACSRTTSISNSIALKSDSLISYEVSPFMGETDSLCSLHLDQMFHENLTQLGKDYTNSFIEISGDEVSDTTSQNNSIPVLSSQEIIEAGEDSLIDINTTEVSAISCLIKNEDQSKSYSSEPPFTVLLSEEEYTEHPNTPSDHFDMDEVLEDVPHHNIDLETEISSVHSNSMSSLNLYETVVDSVKWLIPWLGPKLTTEHIAIPLLRRMSKVFIEYEYNDGNIDAIDSLLQRVSPILDCLIEVALIYGDNIVLYHYLPHVSKLIESALNQASISISLGSSLVTCIQLITETCKMLHGETILKYIEMFSEVFFQPLIRLLSTVKPFSTGSIVRKYLSRKVIDIFGLLCQKLNREIAQEMVASLLQQFFSCFDGIYALRTNDIGETYVTRKYSLLSTNFESPVKDTEKIKRKPSFQNRIKKSNSFDFDHTDSGQYFDHSTDRRFTDRSIDEILENDKVGVSLKEEQFQDIYETFSPSLAYHAYVLLGRVLGTLYIEKTLYNSELIWQLCTKHDEGLTLSSMGAKSNDSSEDTNSNGGATMIPTSTDKSKWCRPIEPTPSEEARFSARSTWQQISGNWMEHWKENIGEQKQNFCYNDLRLQTYAGHSSAIRDLYVPDNEHFFLSASRDKTVKLWLLKNHGNGTAHLGCSRTYDKHTRAVFTVQGIEAKRWVASCDGTVNVWDPVTGQTVCEFDAGRGNTITSLCTLPSPSTCVAVATTEGNLRLFDVRQRRYAQDWKLSPQASTGMVRSICANSSGVWIAAGFSSGIVSVLDLQAGVLRGQARVHDSEIIQMESIPGLGFVSSSMDWNLRLWHEDGLVSHIKKSSNEIIHSVVYTKHLMVWATSSNKLTLHNVDNLSSFQSHRISQDTFKGNLTKMAVLPLNKLYLFGADNGNVVLCA